MFVFTDSNSVWIFPQSTTASVIEHSAIYSKEERVDKHKYRFSPFYHRPSRQLSYQRPSSPTESSPGKLSDNVLIKYFYVLLQHNIFDSWDNFCLAVCSSEADNSELPSPSSNAVIYSNSSWPEATETPSLTLTTVQSHIGAPSSSPSHLNTAPNTPSVPTNSFMSWYPLPESTSYPLTHHHYQPLEYIPLAIPQPEYINTDLQKSEEASPSREENEYECNIEQRLFPKNNNNTEMKPWVQSGTNNDMCLMKDL